MKRSAMSAMMLPLQVLILAPLALGNSDAYTLVLQTTQQTCTDTCAEVGQKCDFNGINKLEPGELKSKIVELLPGFRCYDYNTTLTQYIYYPEFKLNEDGFTFNLDNNCTSGYIFKPEGPIPNCSAQGLERMPRICRCKNSASTTNPETSTISSTTGKSTTLISPKPETQTVSRHSATTLTKRMHKTDDNRWHKLSTSHNKIHLSKRPSTLVTPTSAGKNTVAAGDTLTTILAGIGCAGTLMCLLAIACIILWIKKRRVKKTNESILNTLKSKTVNINNKNTRKNNKTEPFFANKPPIAPPKATSKSYPSSVTPTKKALSIKSPLSQPKSSKKSTNTKTGTVISDDNADQSEHVYEAVGDPKRPNTPSKTVAVIKKM